MCGSLRAPSWYMLASRGNNLSLIRCAKIVALVYPILSRYIFQPPFLVSGKARELARDEMSTTIPNHDP